MADTLIGIACGLILGVFLGIVIERLSSWGDDSRRLIRESDKASRWPWPARRKT